MLHQRRNGIPFIPVSPKMEKLEMDFWDTDVSYLNPISDTWNSGLKSTYRKSGPNILCWKVRKHLTRAMRYTFIADTLHDEFTVISGEDER